MSMHEAKINLGMEGGGLRDININVCLSGGGGGRVPRTMFEI